MNESRDIIKSKLKIKHGEYTMKGEEHARACRRNTGVASFLFFHPKPALSFLHLITLRRSI